jgi:omega-6 fatty acid desaturase (delta-12 desaturase)
MVQQRKQVQKSGSETSADQIKGKLAWPEAKSYKQPTFTLKDIRDQVPSHCFKRYTLTSLSHVAKDLAMASCLFYLATWIEYAPGYLQLPLWATYWWCQGIVCTGIWVLCG